MNDESYHRAFKVQRKGAVKNVYPEQDNTNFNSLKVGNNQASVNSSLAKDGIRNKDELNRTRDVEARDPLLNPSKDQSTADLG